MDDINIEELFSVFDTTENNTCIGVGDKNVCNDCNNILQITNDGDTVCTECGLVSQSSLINETSEWTLFSQENTRCEYNNSELLHDENISTQISFKRKMKPDDWAIMKWQRTMQLSSKDRSLIKVYNRIDHCCINSNINQSIITTTKTLYKFISQKKLTRGDVREAMLTSCLFYAFVYSNNPRNIQEVCEVFGSKPKKVNKTNKMLSIELWKSKWKEILSYELNSEQLIYRYCNNINLSTKQSADIVNISKLLEKSPFMIGKDCSYSAAISIYIYSSKNNLHISKDNICETCFISTVTLNKLIKTQILK